MVGQIASGVGDRRPTMLRGRVLWVLKGSDWRSCIPCSCPTGEQSSTSKESSTLYDHRDIFFLFSFSSHEDECWLL